MKRRLIASLALLGVALAMAVGVGAEEKGKKEPDPLMMKKLEYAQGILAGLAVEDFDKITKNAESMRELGVLSKWFRASDPNYERHLRTFRSANDDLIRYAKEKNLDGSSLAYVQMTIACVNCHKVVRDIKK